MYVFLCLLGNNNNDDGSKDGGDGLEKGGDEWITQAVGAKLGRGGEDLAEANQVLT